VGSGKGQLVCQHLEGISRKALKDYQAIIREFVKGRHGVYALYAKSGRLRYVGLASDLRSRLKTHLKDRQAGTWQKFSVYITITDAHLRDLESLILRIASPSENRQAGKFIRSQDLKPIFRRKLNQAKKREIGILVGDDPDKPEGAAAKETTGRRPVLASYINKRFEIRFRYKGKTYRATVRKDGSILYAGKRFNSPSAAGAAIPHRSVDGWYVWRYQRSPGEWVLLNELRKK
jgi:hypothetical protein